jgi:hypothetical protein
MYADIFLLFVDFLSLPFSDPTIFMSEAALLLAPSLKTRYNTSHILDSRTFLSNAG